MIFAAIPPTTYVDTEELAEEMLNNIYNIGACAIDTETTGLSIVKDVAFLWSVASDTARWALPIEMGYSPIIEHMLDDPYITKVLHNAKFDRHMLANAGISLSGRLYDTLVMDALVDPEETHKLEACVKRVFGIDKKDFKTTFGNKKKGQTTKDLMLQAEPQVLYDYASSDAWYTMRLFRHLEQILNDIHFTQHSTGMDYYRSIELPYTNILYHMERKGILIDIPAIKASAEDALAKMEVLEQEFGKLAGVPININSNPQLHDLFYNILQKDVTSRTSTGKPSLDAKVIKRWKAYGDPIAECLLDYRELKKTHSTNLTPIPKLVDKHNRLHTTYRQAGARTGRLSSANPNLQNIPAKNKDKYNVRAAFIAPPGSKLIVLDYSQIEMRILAHVSKDSKMINAIREGLDLHCLTASKFIGSTYEEILEAKHASDRGEELTGEQKLLLEDRSNAKSIGFGLVYGMGAWSLSKRLDLSVEETKEKIAIYLGAYPGIQKYMDASVALCRKQGYVSTLMGRRRYLPIHSLDKKIQKSAERQAYNTPIQGSAADILKRAQIKCFYDPMVQEINAEGRYHIYQLLQVHDELIFEVSAEIAHHIHEHLQTLMSNPLKVPLAVPLPVAGAVADTWKEGK